MIKSNENGLVKFTKLKSSTYGPIEVFVPWIDMKYFSEESIQNLYNPMKFFNVKLGEFAMISNMSQDYKLWRGEENNDFYCEMLRLKKNTLPGRHISPHEGRKIYTNDSWAQITNEGNVITDKIGNFGGDTFNIQHQLKKVKMLFATWYAFAALLHNGDVVAWGWGRGGKIPVEIQKQLKKNVKMIFHAAEAFVALLKDGSVVAWGPDYGGKIPEEIQGKLRKNVQMIFSTIGAFVALLRDGSVIAWGSVYHGAHIPEEIQIKLKTNGIKMIFSTTHAFAALLNDGKIVAWGSIDFAGGIPEKIQEILKNKNVLTIIPSATSFSAICEGGEEITWNHNDMY